MKLFIVIISFNLLLVASPAFATLNVFACEPEWKSLVEALGGDHVKAFSATNAFQDPHYIEARPSLIAKTRQADLMVCSGAALEIAWLSLLQRQSGNNDIQFTKSGYFEASAQVELLEVPEVFDRFLGDIHALGNPHVHWGPYRMMTIAEALTKRLQMLDPKHSDDYEQKLETFIMDWKANIRNWETKGAVLRGKKVIVFHRNWSYLLAWLNIEEVGDIEPKPGVPPTSSHLATLVNNARSNKPDYILIANYQDPRGAQWLRKKLNVPVLTLPFTVGGSDQSYDLGSLYSEVITTLVEGE